MRSAIDGEPDDSIASKQIPVANLVNTGAWCDAAKFQRRHLEPFVAKIAKAHPEPFKIEAYALAGALEPAIILLARPIDAAALE